jgi:hypothetical protein
MSRGCRSRQWPCWKVSVPRRLFGRIRSWCGAPWLRRTNRATRASSVIVSSVLRIRDIGNEGGPECQFAGSDRSFARTLPSAGGQPWRIHSGRDRPRQSYGSRLWRRCRAMRARSRDARRSGGGRRESHPRANAAAAAPMARAAGVRSAAIRRRAMGDEQRRGRDVARGPVHWILPLLIRPDPATKRRPDAI